MLIMNMKTKKLAFDILGILVIASLMGLAYNFYSAKPLPLIHQEVQVKNISEGELFGDSKSVNQLNGNQPLSAVNIDSVQKTTSKDTAKIASNTKEEKVQTEQPIDAKSGIKNIGYDLLKKYIYDPRITLIDARSPEIYSKGKIGNAINIFPMDEDKNAYFSKITNLSNDKIILIYCDGGDCELSHLLANDMVNFGFRKIFIFIGGWDEWTKRNGKNG